MKLLDLDWEDILLKHHTLDHADTDENGMAIGGTNSHLPISTFHLERYRKELTGEQIDEIISVSSDMMKFFGYNLSS